MPPPLPPSTSSEASPRGGSEYVYGDSTRFHPGFDFIATLRASVSCGVALMNAQHAIDCARSRVADAEEHLVLTRADLFGMADLVEDALASHVTRRTQVKAVALRINNLTRATAAAEIRTLQASLDAAVVRADRTMVDARRSAATALGELLAAHRIPEQQLGFRIVAAESRYDVEAIVSLPVGVRAVFDVTMPADHAFASVVRVRDVCPDLAITIPQSVGWLSPRVEPRALALDGMRVLGASIDGARGALLLGKSERAGVAHTLDVDFAATPVRVQWRDPEDRGLTDLDPVEAARVARLLRTIELRVRPVLDVRTSMTEALVDGHPVGEHDPGDVCARLLSLLAPVAREVAKRSGAAGELVLRRNVDAGHRDEVFVTCAELLEPIDTLPPSLRIAFESLGLRGMPRSRRAPARSLATYEELSAANLIPVS